MIENVEQVVKENFPWIESNIIGLCLRSEIDAIATGLEPDHFTSFPYKKAWSKILEIRHSKNVPDLLTTSNELEKIDTSLNWLSILGDCMQSNLGEASAEGHIKEIKNKWVMRQVSEIGKRMIDQREPDLNTYIKDLMKLNHTEKKYLHSFAEAADDALAEVENVLAGGQRAISTGLIDIDEVTGGLHNSDLIVVAARPAMGKTAFLLNLAAANNDVPLIFSTEQSRIQAVYRMFSIHGGIPNHKIRTGEIDDNDFGMMASAIARISDSNGWIYDKSGPYMSEIESTAREVYQNHNCSAIYLDYLQRIKHENPKLPKHEQVGDIAMRLKELARELDIPVVALAQVSRKCEDRSDKRPQMGDIKDSGTIEQEADSILTLYRDDVYFEDSPDKGTCEIDFKKNRHGGTGMKRVAWLAPTMQFKNLTTNVFN